MVEPTNPANQSGDEQARLASGLEVVEEWSESAGQAEQNAVYEALFAVSDGSVYDSYEIVDEEEKAREFSVLVKDDLAVRVQVRAETFGVAHIGAPEELPRPESDQQNT